jgi:hypothetical protein
MLGIKLCAVALEKMKESQSFSRVFIEIFNEEANK